MQNGITYLKELITKLQTKFKLNKVKFQKRYYSPRHAISTITEITRVLLTSSKKQPYVFIFFTQIKKPNSYNTQHLICRYALSHDPELRHYKDVYHVRPKYHAFIHYNPLP